MRHDDSEQHVNPDAPLPHAQSQHVDASNSAVSALQSYLGLGNTAFTSDAQIISALSHHEWMVRVKAIRHLERLQELAHIPHLIAALQDEHQAVRAAAARALGPLPVHTAITPLVTTLEDTSWHVRAEAALALGKHVEQAPIEPLVRALQDKDDAVRAAATCALGQLGARVPIECLIKALYDPVWSVREAAAQALGEQGTRAPITPLLLARNDEDSSVREAVEWALQQTHPEMFTTTPANTNTGPVDIVGAITGVPTDLPPSTEGLDDGLIQDIDTVHGNRKMKALPSASACSPQAVPMQKDQISSDTSIARQRPAATSQKSARQSRKTAQGSSLVHFIERGLAAAVIIGIALSWLFLNQHINTSNTGSPWHVSREFTQLAPAGETYTRVTWLATGTQSAPLIAAFDTKGHVHIWNTDNEEMVELQTHFQQVVALARVNNSLLVAYTSSGNSQQLELARVVMTEDIAKTHVENIASRTDTVEGTPVAAWSADGHEIALAWNNKKASTALVQLWDIARGKNITILPSCSTTLDKNGDLERKPGTITALAWTNDGKEISTACTGSAGSDQNHTIENWNAATGQSARALNNTLAQYRPISVSDEVSTLAWSPDNNYLAYLLTDGEIHILPQKSDQMSDIWLNYGYSNHSRAFNGVLAWSPDSKDLAATTAAVTPVGAITGWDTTGNQLYAYTGHTQPVSDLEWSQDGKSIASVSKDGTLQIWEASKP
jgi:WD40 repeat protein